MGAVEIRAAITAFFQPPAVPGLVEMYKAVPYYIAGDRWQLATNLGTAAVGAVHLDQQAETRITVGAPAAPGFIAGGSKRVDWKCGIVVFYQFLIDQNPGVPSTNDEWVGPLDDILEGITTRIRSDQTLGTGAGGVIFQAGEGLGDIRVSRDLPRRSSGVIMSWNVVEFDVTEIVQA
jgi:hypothetical protein